MTLQVYNPLKGFMRLKIVLLILLIFVYLPSVWAAELSVREKQQLMLSDYNNQLATQPIWSQRVSVSYGKRFIKLQTLQLGEVIYGLDWRGTLSALSLESGKVLWKRELGVSISAGVGGSDELLLIGTADGEMIALNPLDGSDVWHHQLSSESLSIPLLADDWVVVHSNDGYIYGLSKEAGEQIWAYQYKVPALTLRGTSSPIYVDGMVLVGLDSGKMVALDIKTGSVNWEQTIAIAKGHSELQRMVDIDAKPLIHGSSVYVVSYQGRIASLDIASGRVLWIRDFSSYSGMTADNENLYVSDAQGDVSAINLSNGATLWTQSKLAGLLVTEPVLNHQQLIIAADDGFLYWLAIDSGELLSRVSTEALAARLRGMEWDLWHDYDRSALNDFYDKDTGINAAVQRLKDGSLLVLDNQGYLTRFTH